MAAVKTDAELNELLGQVVFPNSGVMPHIHSVLRKCNKVYVKSKTLQFYHTFTAKSLKPRIQKAKNGARRATLFSQCVC